MLDAYWLWGHIYILGAYWLWKKIYMLSACWLWGQIAYSSTHISSKCCRCRAFWIEIATLHINWDIGRLLSVDEKCQHVRNLRIINHIRSKYAAFSVCMTFWEVLSLCLDFSLYHYIISLETVTTFASQILLFSFNCTGWSKPWHWASEYWRPTTLSSPGTTPRASTQELALSPLRDCLVVLMTPTISTIKTVSSHCSCSVSWSVLYIKI